MLEVDGSCFAHVDSDAHLCRTSQLVGKEFGNLN